MSRTKMLCLIAGSALGWCGAAMAQSTDQGKAYQADLLADAQGKTSMLAAPAVGAPEIHGQIQFRYIWNTRDESGDDNDSTAGFQTRRTKIWAEGEIAEGWGYNVRLAFDRDGGSAMLENAYVTYQADDAWQILWGQFKLPFMREELVSSSKQLAVDRSITNELFNQDYSQGVQATFQQDAWRFMGAFSDGFATGNTDFTSGAEADFALTARGEFMGAGEWDNFTDFTSWKEAPFGWMIGGAAHWQSGGETVGTVDMDAWAVTLDASFEGNGWNAFVAGVFRNVDIGAGDDTEDFGWNAQGGIFLSADWELFGRFAQIFPDSDAGGAKTFHEFAVGFNHYVIPESHAAKFTVDLVVWPNAVDGSNRLVGPNTGIGLLADTGDPQWALRGQFQLLF